MLDINEFNYINELFDLYKNLLTDKQRDIMEKYFSYNLSLKELSDELKISRSAVLDTIDHSIIKLKQYEEKLKLHDKYRKIVKLLDETNVSEKDKEEIIGELYGIWGFTREIH